MIRYIIRRLLWGSTVILAVTLAVFVLFGPVMQWKSDVEPARIYAGKNAQPEQIERVSKILGLDKPFYEQYGIMVRRLVLGPSQTEQDRLCPNSTPAECHELVGHLGQSFEKRRSVDKLILDRLSVTFSLALVGAVIWMSIAIPVGVLSAIRPRSFFDRFTVVFILIGQSLPVYYFGLVALYFFAYTNKIFPSGGYETFEWSHPWPWLSHLLLPGLTLALQFTALYARLVRGGMLDALGEDYVRTARAKGASERRTVVRHALRNALLPIVTLFGLDLGILFGGAILTEATFGLQGIGSLSVDAANRFDVPTTAGIVLFAAVCIVLANIVVDLLLAVVDPRIRLT